MLWFKTQSAKLRKESCIRVNIREFSRVPSIKYLSYIYWTNSLHYTKPSLLKKYMLFIRSIYGKDIVWCHCSGTFYIFLYNVWLYNCKL